MSSIRNRPLLLAAALIGLTAFGACGADGPAEVGQSADEGSVRSAASRVNLAGSYGLVTTRAYRGQLVSLVIDPRGGFARSRCTANNCTEVTYEAGWVTRVGEWLLFWTPRTGGPLSTGFYMAMDAFSFSKDGETLRLRPAHEPSTFTMHSGTLSEQNEGCGGFFGNARQCQPKLRCVERTLSKEVAWELVLQSDMMSENEALFEDLEDDAATVLLTYGQAQLKAYAHRATGVADFAAKARTLTRQVRQLARQASLEQDPVAFLTKATAPDPSQFCAPQAGQVACSGTCAK
ncbi:MAG: hypothetical protein IT371_23125 [Deltaproteobacteria bacterium]|nr:hypothetical protein [Deltaproteobacteria bacterium]